MPTPTQLRLTIESLFEVIRSRSTAEEMTIICPEPGCGDTSGNRGINLRTGKTGCWRCNKGGSFVPWAKRLGYEVDYGNTPAPTVGELDSMIDDLDTLHKPAVSGYVPSVRLPRGFISVKDRPNSAYAQLIGEMAVRKHLSFEDFSSSGVGFTREDPRWEPYAIFPIFEWGRPVYYQGRTYSDPEPDPATGKRGSTKLFPTRNECPLGSRYWVYGIDELRAKPGQTALVVEAILNVLSLRAELHRRGITGVVPLAVFKHKVSFEQQQKILMCKPSETCLMFDNDAIASAMKGAGYLVNGTPTSVVEMPVGVDPNDDAIQAVQLFENRKRFDRFSNLTV